MNQQLQLVTDKSKIDLSNVMRVFAHAPWTKDRSREKVSLLLQNSSLVVLALCNGRPVAFARVLTDFAFRAFVEDVIVVSDSRRKGIGQALMQEVERLLRQRNVQRIDLVTRRVGFWDKAGYRVKAGAFYMCKELAEQA